MLKQYGKLRIFFGKRKTNNYQGNDLEFNLKECTVRQDLNIIVNNIRLQPLFYSFSYDFKGSWIKISVFNKDL